MKPVLVLQHVPHETLGMLAPCLESAGLSWQTVELYRRPRDPPMALPLGGAAGLVVLGGPMNVDQVERFPCLDLEVHWIREALERELPTLGVCLGSQLLAKALGARVSPNPRKEIGWYEIRLTPEAEADPLFEGVAPSQVVFQWHGDTFELPDRAVHLARSELCVHQAFRYGTSAWGLQFHVEMTRDLVESWFAVPENRDEVAGLDDIDPRGVLARLPEALPRVQALGDRVLSRFAAFCRDRA